MKIAQIGEEILTTPALKVEQQAFAQPHLLQFIEELLTTMLEANGIGIAAPQVFDSRAIMFIASKSNPRYPDAPDMQPTVLINPEIWAQSEELVWEWEGCLSVPGLRGNIQRPNWVDVEYQNQQGEFLRIRFEGFIARIFLHEYDHLIGKTWLDHITDTRHIMANDVWLEKFVK